MKRAALTVMSTLAGLVVLLGFKTVPLTTGTAASASSSSTTSSSSGSTPSTTAAAPQTVTGQSISTRWGDVQVQVTYSGTKITDVTPVTLPSGNPKDVQINTAATPVLEQEALAAQSADIDMVSGATYTSQGYVASLQSALDQVSALTDGQS